MKLHIAATVALSLFLTQEILASKIVSYFAGKDETCLVMGPEGVVEGAKKKLEKVQGKITQLISVTDYHGGGDSEAYCTVAVDVSGKKKERRFSSSPQNCTELATLASGDKIATLEVSKDHLCNIVAAGK